jgi:preprotein translocase subunit SecG
VLTKITAGLTVAFMTLALVLSVWGSRGTSSVVGGVEPPATAPAAATTPVTPAPATTTPETTPPPAAESAPAPPPAKKQ